MFESGAAARCRLGSNRVSEHVIIIIIPPPEARRGGDCTCINHAKSVQKPPTSVLGPALKNVQI